MGHLDDLPVGLAEDGPTDPKLYLRVSQLLQKSLASSVRADFLNTLIKILALKLDLIDNVREVFLGDYLAVKGLIFIDHHCKEAQDGMTCSEELILFTEFDLRGIFI